MAKSSKTLQDALSAVLQKHNLKPQDASVTIVSVFVHERAYNRYHLCISSTRSTIVLKYTFRTVLSAYIKMQAINTL